jgi:glycogen debranching enzyme
VTVHYATSCPDCHQWLAKTVPATYARVDCVTAPQVNCLEGNTFMVSDLIGDVDPDPDQVLGLFYRDMRHLSRWHLVIDGARLETLSNGAYGYQSATFFLAGPGGVYQNPTLSVIRERTLGKGGEDLHEKLTVINSGRAEIVIGLSMIFDADFADLFEVKSKQLIKKGIISHRVRGQEVELIYRREDFERRTVVHADGARLSQGSAHFLLRLRPAESWSGTLRVSFVAVAPREQTGATSGMPSSKIKHSHPISHRDQMNAWLDAAPIVRTSWDTLRHTYDRSLRDLAALRLHTEALPEGAAIPAAGLPWFMAVFGRDSLITSYQALPFVPQLASATLQVLARHQATERDDFRDAEPGKILHELRFGELTYFGDSPQSPYYGSADSTPLFLILLDEYERWSGDTDLMLALEPQARAALDWLEHHGDLDGDGYLEYERRNVVSGLENQCWKDSWDSIVYPDGRLASLPRATCELQGYAYDARIRTARLARKVWRDSATADRLERDAADLKARFNTDFWVEDGDFFALALDGDKHQVPTLTSNMGQLLWSGIVDDSKVDAVVDHLMGERLFSGWGVRTLATGQPAFNPLSYHDGTVWPHDNGLIAAGLARYRRRDEAGRIAVAIFEAAAHFDHRLPEVFAGYPRSLTEFPVEYPTACSPQAWGAGTPLLLIRVLLGLEPQGNGLTSTPYVPGAIGSLGVTGVPSRWGRADTPITLTTRGS